MQRSLFAIVVSSFLLSMHQVVVADDMDAFVEACLSATNIERPMCECTARKAKQELSPKGFDFVVAVLRQDEAVTAKLRAEMTVQETMKAGTFMTRGPMQCAQEG